mmetsp:Transcript_27381/g.93457  ORF Transcript_27381/g.93457 Transcript_27381/m.93457 type:complete len:380 (-) Transcript_27381:1445-2584(-)
MGSSHSGPSRAPHWKPCTTLSRTAASSDLSVSPARVSSMSRFGPCRDGPKAHTLRLAIRSHPYFCWKYCPWRFLGQPASTFPASMSSARPWSNGSAIIVSLLRLFGVSAKHLIELVSDTVSQKLTTGSATFTSMSLYSSRRSRSAVSRKSSPVPRMVCSPDSSTFVTASGNVLFTLRRPSTILGRSEGFRGSAAIFTTLEVSNLSGANMCASSRLAEGSCATSVAVLNTDASTPSTSTTCPATARSTLTRYRACISDSAVASRTAQSSSSSGEYASPSTRTSCPSTSVPLCTLHSASKLWQSGLGTSFTTFTSSSAAGSHARMPAASSPSSGPVYVRSAFTAAPSAAHGRCCTTMSTSPVAVPNTLVRHSFSRGLTSSL